MCVIQGQWKHTADNMPHKHVQLSNCVSEALLYCTQLWSPLRGFWEHLLLLMFPRHTVSDICIPPDVPAALCSGEYIEDRDDVTILIITVQCPIFDQASQRAVQHVCLHAARRNSGLPVLIITEPVFFIREACWHFLKERSSPNSKFGCGFKNLKWQEFV